MYGPYDIPDHPDIVACMRTGYPAGREPHWPVCPVCGEECSTVYEDSIGTIFGCDNCVDIQLVEGDENNPGCPYCKPEPCRLYIRDGETKGCENCVTEKDAWEWDTQQREDW